MELVPGGHDVKVTEANKHEYVNLIARHRMTTSIKAQIQVRLLLLLMLAPQAAAACTESLAVIVVSGALAVACAGFAQPSVPQLHCNHTTCHAPALLL